MLDIVLKIPLITYTYERMTDLFKGELLAPSGFVIMHTHTVMIIYCLFSDNVQKKKNIGIIWVALNSVNAVKLRGRKKKVKCDLETGMRLRL